MAQDVDSAGVRFSLSSSSRAIILQMPRSPEVPGRIQKLLRSMGIRRGARRNLFRGHVGVGKIELSRRSLNDYTDTVQHLEVPHISATVFTGLTTVILVVQADSRGIAKTRAAVAAALKQ